MPAVAYLEMARAAVREAIGADTTPEDSYLHLMHVVWARPLVVGALPVTVRITLEPQESGTLVFLISRESEREPDIVSSEEETAAQIYGQGLAVFRTQRAFPNVDLPAVQARCQRQISTASCYDRLRELGFSYGPAMQGIEQLSVGDGEILARLRLPVGVVQTCDARLTGYSADPGAQMHVEGNHRDVGNSHPYVLHPSVLDAALQACIGLLMEQNTHQAAHLPFALEELSIVSETPTQGWAWVRQRSASERLHSPPSMFDIEICDDEGRVAVVLRGLSTRELPGSFGLTPQYVLLTPIWQEVTGGDLPHLHSPLEETPLTGPSLVLLCELPSILASRLQDQMTSGGHCRSLPALRSPVPTAPIRQLHRGQRFQDLVVQLIQELQHLLRSRLTGSVLIQVVVAHREEPSLLGALSSVLKTAQQEYPTGGQLIEVEGEPEEEKLLAYLRENQRCPQESHIRYRDGKRWVREWQEHQEAYAPTNIPWKEGGCYLITGGAGGLARLFVQDIARQIQEATIILAGRSALSDELRAQLAPQAENSDIRIDYQQVDVSDGPAVQALIARVQAKSGHLDGIIHAAGVLRDSLLLNKTPAEVQAVLAAKVIGVELLDEASSQIPLDFFLLCSSANAVMGNVGQADYAAANAYLDAFAHARQAQVRAGQRHGTTVSINWPLWEEGGMHVEAETVQMMRTRMGIEPMGTEMGIRTLYQALASGLAQVMVAHGQVERIKQQLGSPVGTEPCACTPTTAVRTSDHDHKAWQDRLRESLAHMVSRLLKVRVEEIDTETDLSEYGFDSITFTAFANHLNQTYQLDLTPPLFFEHSTIERLSQYLQTAYATILAPHFPVDLPIAKSRTSKDAALVAPTEADNVQPQGLQFPRRQARVARSLVYAPESRTPVAIEPIAIIGMSGSFPQAPDVQSLWSNLLAGRNCISEIPPSRWDWQTYFGNPAVEPNKTNVKWAGIVEDVELFDPRFFGISRAEAEQMDPQQRLLMMYVWKAIEDAGYAAESLSGTNTALFIGTTASGYSERLSRAGVTIEGYSSTGQILSVGPNRVSYFLNLHGPSEAIETACSISLVAVHRGVNAIESGQCSMAIVGGVNALVSPALHISYSKAGMLCEDGRCKSFAASANGYVRSEGVGILMLKRLSEAEQAGDHIYGVIRGSAENHGGRASSLTAPNPRAQADVLIAAYRKAGIDPRTVGYIEAHGTGTPLGDPIEINGLKTAFSELRTGTRHSPYDTTGSELRTGTRHILYDEGEGPTPHAWCGIGSVKSNIGHLEWAAGVAGVIKVLLQMQHKTLVKSLHCEQVNPYIQLEGSPFYLVQENQEWEVLRDRTGNVLPRRAGVSSFGFGGANAHVVLEEYVPKPMVAQAEGAASPNAIIVLSAKNAEQLHEQVRQLLAWVQTETVSGEPVGQAQDQRLPQGQHEAPNRDVGAAACPCPLPPPSLQDLAYTLQVGRVAMEERLAFQVNSFAELEEKLHRFLQGLQEGGNWYRGQVKQSKETVAFFRDDEELQEAIDKWLQRGKYEKLLQGWVKGLTIDWKRLYSLVSVPSSGSRKDIDSHRLPVGKVYMSNPNELSGNAPKSGSTQDTTIGASPMATAALTLPRRISLPTYPFARERYWIPANTNLHSEEPFSRRGVPLWSPVVPIGGRPQGYAPTQDHPANIASPHATWYKTVGTGQGPADRGQPLSLQVPALHPLVQRNTSTLWEQRFSSTFAGNEFFLADHVIEGQRVMPGVAYLEMVRAAVREAIGADAPPEKSYLHLSHVVWLRPVIVGELPVTVHIILETQDNETITFVISYEEEGTGAQICCQGTASVVSVPSSGSRKDIDSRRLPGGKGYPPNPHESSGNALASAIPNVDLTSVQARCQHQILATECYQRYREMGMRYGPALQGIEQLSVGEDEVLARLHSHKDRACLCPHPYVLHPGVLDAALQGCIVLDADQNEQKKPLLPFALDKLEIMHELPAQGWAWIRRRHRSTEGSVFDIEVCDNEGRVAVQLTGLSTRQLPSRDDLTRTVLLTPVWKEVADRDLPHSPCENTPLTTISPCLVLLCELPAILATRIQDQMASGGICRSLSVGKGLAPIGANLRASVRVEHTGEASSPLHDGTSIGPVPSCRGELASPSSPALPPVPDNRSLKFAPMGLAPFQQTGREQRFQDLVVQLIQELQDLLRSQPAGAVFVQVVVAHPEERCLLEALGGVLKTAQQEYPQLRGQLIEVEGEPEVEQFLLWLHENQSRMPQEPHIRYRDGKRWVREWQEYPASSSSPIIPWQEGGCYLITGGAGGLAQLFVQEIARQVQKATIILAGRSVWPEQWHAPLELMGKKQIHIDYQQVDVTDGPAVDALIQRVLTKSGHLDGIIHAAGVLRDSLLLNKTPEEALAVLAPKVIGVERLDEASSQLPLDFFILCSSATAVLGNVGQADYAAANAYLDAFAHARQVLVTQGKRLGVTLAINWPLWQEGGMQIEAEAAQMMRQRLGTEVMGTEIGMKTLYQALASGLAQVMVAHGQVERIKQQLGSPVGTEPCACAPTTAVRTSDHDHKAWQDRLRESLTHMVSRLLKVRVEEIDTETDLSEYGFDSITFTAFANHLNQTYQLDLTPALFFEHATLQRLAQYLQTTYAIALAPHFSIAAKETVIQPVTAVQMGIDEVPPVKALPRRRPLFRPKAMPGGNRLAPEATSPIAIIGLSGMFPQAHDIQSFWRNLLAGRDCIREIPAARWDGEATFGHPGTASANTTNVKWAGVVDGIDTFDPQFFGITPREAEHMDPQQRLLMMYVWKAIEDAGYAASSLSGTNTALFIGTTSSGYSERISRAHQSIESYTSTSRIASVGPNRMSYFLNLHGPSEPIETACSSSLVAIHRGVQAIASGQCNMAIVGGINTLVSPELHMSFCKAGMLSEDGRCKAFSAQANGYVRGEGVGMLVLKKLSEAEQDDDHIYGVIRASAENHGGRASSLTSPNPRAQADLLLEAYRRAGIDPRTVGYIEAHGTGTVLGDPIEINGLKTAWSELLTGTRHSPSDESEGPMPEATCGIGSVKSNIGHLELAAGVAGVIKVLLQMQHKQLVKSLHCEQINPYIQLEDSPFYIVREQREWEAPRDHAGNPLPRRAGVSSFGFGGVNAHIVLEEYVPKPQTKPTPSRALQSPAPPFLIVLSAKTEEQLHEQVRQLLAWLQEEMGSSSPSLQDLAYTLQVGREALEERLALQVSALAELIEKLQRYLQEPQKAGDWYRGQVKRHKETVEILRVDEEWQEVIGKWYQRGKYEQLLQWWVKGLSIEWQHLYTAGAPARPRRISLPTYPFAQERYWIPTPKIEPTPSITSHPPTGKVHAPNPNGSSGNALGRVALRPLADSSALSQPPFQILQTLQLEQELTRSLAAALYLKPSDIDSEIPFVDMGLDSVIGVEWVQSLNKQYTSNLAVSCVYDYPTIRQLALFLEKEELKQERGTEQTPVAALSSLSLDDVLQQVQQGSLDTDQAEKLLRQHFL